MTSYVLRKDRYKKGKSVRGPPGIGFKLTDDGNYDMENKRLCNVSEPIEDIDACTKKYIHPLESKVRSFTNILSELKFKIKDNNENLTVRMDNEKANCEKIKEELKAKLEKEYILKIIEPDVKKEINKACEELNTIVTDNIKEHSNNITSQLSFKEQNILSILENKIGKQTGILVINLNFYKHNDEGFFMFRNTISNSVIYRIPCDGKIERVTPFPEDAYAHIYINNDSFEMLPDYYPINKGDKLKFKKRVAINGESYNPLQVELVIQYSLI